MRIIKKWVLDKTRDVLGYLLRDLPSASNAIRESVLDIHLELIKDKIRSRDPHAVVLHGYRVYSQCDEDGIIEHIFGLIGEKSRLFIEVGCGNGIENNTHWLLLKGWKGIWIDGNRENVAFIHSQLECERSNALSVREAFVTAENINALITRELQYFGLKDFPTEIDLFSLDIDGNELHVIRALEVVKPRVICIEYNAKFPPPMEVAMEYNPAHRYAGDDYQGASLQCIANLLEMRGYRLVACSISGVNAFFVKASELVEKSAGDIRHLYQPPRHYLIASRPGLVGSLRFARDKILGTKSTID